VPRAKISALGCYVPPRILTNFDFEKIVETSNQWILERTGISERHIAAPEVATSDLAVEAAKIALAARGIAPSDVDAIIVSTVTPDMMFPSTACIVQHRLDAKGVWGFDLIAACCSFLYGMTTAAQLVAGGRYRKILLIGADTMSRIIDYTDRATCILFGDGAGAFIVEASEDDSLGFIDALNEIDGSGGGALYMPAGGSRKPASLETVQNREHYVHQEGQQVFKFAVRRMYEVCRDLLAKNDVDPQNLAVLVPHQANRRIITACAERLGLDCSKVIINIDRYGNTTSATIPLATREAVESGRLKKGDLVLFSAVGAGFTVGASLWRWAY
jgi:3-oxoacyl-[acyl-carrier-protein] synthase III